MKTISSFGSVAAVLFLVVACGRSAGAVGASSSPTHAAMHHAAVDIATSRFGQILVDGQGRTLYLFASDPTGVSNCDGACATAWPPLLTEKGAKVDAMHAASGLLGTTTRKDGTVQVTYNGHPLYYFEGDTQAGQITCQAVVNFGAAWYVVDPNGNAITTKG